MLFVFHHARHARDTLHHFGIGVAHLLGDESGQLIQVRVGDADHAGIAHRAAHDLAQHVAAAFVRRQHAIVDQKRGGAGVIGIDAQDGVGAVVLAVGLPEQFAGPVDDGPHQVGIVVRKLALHARPPCAPDPCRCRWTGGQRRQLAGRIAIELHEHQVPDFDEAPAGSSRERSPGPGFGAEDRSGSPSTGRTVRFRPSARNCPFHPGGKFGPSERPPPSARALRRHRPRETR